ncbi:MAG TPA: gamma carbonic anhydrase family protein [Armatimonadota bacterium]|nr:gamma carbonic anhydrase family protein [Armatimonadota bacterium]
MTDVKINTNRPALDNVAFVAKNATVIGDVTLGRNVSIWYGASVRGDMAAITIGDGSNVQENATVHVDPGIPVSIGAGVTIGHNAVIHGATIEDDVLIGMGAIVLNHAVVGTGSIIAAGAVVREGMVVPPGSLVAGVPGKILKELTPEQQAHIRENGAIYVECAKAHQRAAEAEG